MDIADDILHQLSLDFPPSEANTRLEQLKELSPESERILRCIVFAARGHPSYFDYLCKLARRDFRDVIPAADAPNGTRLYDFNKPIPQARIGVWATEDSDSPFDPAHLDGRTLVIIK